MGKFISFCGIDGCGKTTQAEMLVTHLVNLGFDVVHLRGFNPPKYSGELKKIAKKIKHDFHDMFSSDMRTASFILDLINVTANTIIPAIEENRIVVSEKYFIDTQIYAPLLGTRVEQVEMLSKSLLTPDLYLYLDIPAEKSISRIKKRAISKNIPIAPKESIEIAKCAQQQFTFFAEQNNEKCIVFSAEQNPNALHEQITKAVIEYLKKEV